MQLNHAETLAPFLLQYLKRLSDLLFILTRVINRADGFDETLRQKR